MTASTESSSQKSPEKAYAYIKEKIIDLELAPGRKLRSQVLAEELALSRTPVREALGRLEQEGLVRRDAGWGYVVRGMTFKEIFELFKIRESLEVLAATEALTFIDPEKLKNLKAILEKSAKALKADKRVQFRLLSREFHMTLASYSNNDLLNEILVSINDRVRLVAAMQLDLRTERADEILNDNRAILNALESGNAEAVRLAILHHIGNARSSLLKSAGMSPSTFAPTSL